MLSPCADVGENALDGVHRLRGREVVVSEGSPRAFDQVARRIEGEESATGPRIDQDLAPAGRARWIADGDDEVPGQPDAVGVQAHPPGGLGPDRREQDRQAAPAVEYLGQE